MTHKKQEIKYTFIDPNKSKDVELMLHMIALEKLRALRKGK